MIKLKYITLILIISIPSFAQDTSRSGNIDLKIGMSDWGTSYRNNYGIYGLNVNYRTGKYITGGVHIGYGATKLYNFIEGHSIIGTHMLVYGLSACFYFTPLYNKAPDPKVDFYARGKIGAYNLYPTESQTSLIKETIFDYGGYLGIEFNPLKRLGLFGEAGFGALSSTMIGIKLTLGK